MGTNILRFYITFALTIAGKLADTLAFYH